MEFPSADGKKTQWLNFGELLETEIKEDEEPTGTIEQNMDPKSKDPKAALKKKPAQGKGKGIE